MYGLKTAPKAWQDYIAELLKELGFTRCKSDSNLYYHKEMKVYLLLYVDDVLVFGKRKEAQFLFDELAKRVLLRSTGELKPGTSIKFIGRELQHNGDSIDIKPLKNYIDDLLTTFNMSNCKPSTTTGTSTVKEDEAEELLNPTEHSLYRVGVGKLQWLCPIRDDLRYACKELARGLSAPTRADMTKLKHLLRYLQGTKDYVCRLRPSHTLSGYDNTFELDVYVDSDWAGCRTTRKSTSGTTCCLLGCSITSTSKTQQTIALSSGEAELYAIGSGLSEALYLRNLLLESELATKVKITLHTEHCWQSFGN